MKQLMIEECLSRVLSLLTSPRIQQSTDFLFLKCEKETTEESQLTLNLFCKDFGWSFANMMKIFEYSD